MAKIHDGKLEKISLTSLTRNRERVDKWGKMYIEDVDERSEALQGNRLCERYMCVRGLGKEKT